MSSTTTGRPSNLRTAIPTIDRSDAAILTPLAERLAHLATAPEQEERRQLWRLLNSLKPVRPLVHICQEPWHEFEGRVYTLACRGELARQIEAQLRQKLWRAEFAPADDVCEASVWTMAVTEEEPWGLSFPPRRVDMAVDYPSQIRSLDDVARIRLPTIRYDAAATQAKTAAIAEACGAAVRVVPALLLMPALWDLLVQWYGTEELMTDLYDNPALVHAAVRRTTDLIQHRLHQFEEQGAITLGTGEGGAGNGGLSYTNELPRSDFAGRVRCCDLWGNQMAQIFAGVSADMHDEFALRYEIEILERFGLNCYGCCEPLDRKIHIVERIPRLRRVSMSPWVDHAVGAKAIAGRFIHSAKPNPAHLAAERFNLEVSRRELQGILAATRGAPVELVLKDLHTLREEPERLTAWVAMAMELVQREGT